LRADNVLTSGSVSDGRQIFGEIERARTLAGDGVYKHVEKITLPVTGLGLVQLYTAQLYKTATNFVDFNFRQSDIDHRCKKKWKKNFLQALET